jgi:hypothetical protein
MPLQAARGFACFFSSAMAHLPPIMFSRGCVKSRFEQFAAASYLAAIFVYCFAGVGPGRMLLGLTTALWIVHLLRSRTWPEMPAVGWWALAYSAWVTLALIWGPTDDFHANQFYKHVAWLNIPLAYALIRGTERRRWMIWSFTAGGVVLSLRILTRVTRAWQEGVAAGLVVDQARMWDRIWYHIHLDGTDLISRLIDVGGMQDGQRMAVSLIAAVMTLVLARGKMRGWGLVAILFTLAGVLLSFKRGPWVTLSILAILSLGIAAWRYPLRRALFIVVAAVTLIWGGAKLMPEGPAQAWTDLQTSIDQSIPKGGRVAMWFQITPELVKEYPWGIGYKALDGQMMRQISRRIPPHQAHVHSNPLQAAVDGGWVGLALFVGWCFYAFRNLIRYIGATTPQSDERRLAWTVSAMFLTLFLIGFVEYQLGSGQITMMYGVLMGAAAIAARETRTQHD